MGGTRTLTVDGEVILKEDNKESYSGRGAKYNSSIRYDIQSYDLSQKEYDVAVDSIAKAMFAIEKIKAEKLVTDKLNAQNWENDIDWFLQDVKQSWHLGRCRVWHNVIPCSEKSYPMNYLKNQLRNWLLTGNKIEKFGFRYYENDYNYSSYYFLSKVQKLNKNNPAIWAIFDRELGNLEVSEQSINGYYNR